MSPVNLLDPPPNFWHQAFADLNTRRLNYIARYWESQLFGETMDGACGPEFISRLDQLIREHPEIE